MNAYRMKPLKYPWPPLLYVGACVLAFFLNAYIAPVSPFEEQEPVMWMTGAMIATGAIAIDFWAIKTLMSNYTPLSQHQRARRLVTEGPYRYSRNPIYLGYTLLMIAAGMILGNVWLILAAPLTAMLTTMIAIRCEEMHLLVRFGVDFERYCQHTRRWL
ncbi:MULTISPECIES: methyltransferase family protein [Rhizobium/Agrobacterium group]|uniref:methyltransferase family protein n=1 Tax=Rhizobium/Agrobacterium group TaxID=227290 RepID=UPI0008DC0A85|nr:MULTISPECIES: isoprenylcysteine carboxylmethyltransferase family protein [Rhizobium/Agrobacterium group]MCF1434970.1 isoprenylcysteine carboxylmethyltransferase family protein [Allorhizobium ampelinum]MCF1471299.1 isoprenylcysteine carboxylmethyltransferase family protein [Allorhizobium ampelinum]MUO91551.1 DUF1295 domain-containing protein [Agrobacterium vitis]MUZ55024.1 DUF1295 domain-containing protein [Agrobacterium vitis]MUZ65823.1 DUF1295 domain-containing protein [Agrobacterium vitis